MSSPVPLNYRVAKAQVSQFIEGGDPSFYDNQASVLNTIAQSNPGSSSVSFATELTSVEYYEPPDPAVSVEYPN